MRKVVHNVTASAVNRAAPSKCVARVDKLVSNKRPRIKDVKKSAEKHEFCINIHSWSQGVKCYQSQPRGG